MHRLQAARVIVATFSRHRSCSQSFVNCEKPMKAPLSIPPGATVVIPHHVRDGKQADYEIWLEEIVPICRAYPGHLDWQLIPPLPGLSETFTFFIRFDTIEHLRQWMESDDRRRLIEN